MPLGTAHNGNYAENRKAQEFYSSRKRISQWCKYKQYLQNLYLQWLKKILWLSGDKVDLRKRLPVTLIRLIHDPNLNEAVLKNTIQKIGKTEYAFHILTVLLAFDPVYGRR